MKLKVVVPVFHVGLFAIGLAYELAQPSCFLRKVRKRICCNGTGYHECVE